MSEDMPKTRCDELGFEHAWRDYKNVFDSWHTVKYRQEYCPNCGLVRSHKKKSGLSTK